MTAQLKILLREKNNMENENRRIFLSPSKLNLFQDCPHCFWLQEIKRRKRPEGPTSTLPRGMDFLIKDYFDKYRALGTVPPEIEGKVMGIPIKDQKLLSFWRNWRTGLRYFDEKLNAELGGALDECFVFENNYIPVDYKTRGFALKEDSLSYYQTQLDCYTFLLQANGHKHLFFGYLIYYIPKKAKEEGAVEFEVNPQKLATSPKRGYEIFKSAVGFLRGPKPSLNDKCQFCLWANNFSK